MKPKEVPVLSAFINSAKETAAAFFNVFSLDQWDTQPRVRMFLEVVFEKW